MTDYADILEHLQYWYNDPMWADHAEVPKIYLKKAADEIERLRKELLAITNELNDADIMIDIVERLYKHIEILEKNQVITSVGYLKESINEIQRLRSENHRLEVTTEHIQKQLLKYRDNHNDAIKWIQEQIDESI
jgi:hypothetical protein